MLKFSKSHSEKGYIQYYYGPYPVKCQIPYALNGRVIHLTQEETEKLLKESGFEINPNPHPFQFVKPSLEQISEILANHNIEAEYIAEITYDKPAEHTLIHFVEGGAKRISNKARIR